MKAIDRMSSNRTLGALAVTACALLAGCASQTPTAPGGEGMQTITVTPATPLRVPGHPPRLQLAAVNDHRCPADVRCAWAGHASVALEVWRAGVSPQVVLVGTSAPPAMNLPGTARAGDYRFTLVDLRPTPASNGKPNLLDYRAVIQVAREH